MSSDSVRLTIKRKDLPVLHWFMGLGVQGCAPPEELPPPDAAERREDMAAAERFISEIEQAMERRGNE